MDKIRYEVFARDIISINFTIRNTPDGQSGVISLFWEFKKAIMETEERLTLYKAQDERDYDLNHFMFSYTMNLCKAVRQAKKNLLSRVMAEGFFKALSSNYSCPVKKNSKYNVQNLTISDTLLPPIPTEERFRIEMNVFTKPEGQKKFTKTYKMNLFVKIKK
jgi:hypothetical protein